MNASLHSPFHEVKRRISILLIASLLFSSGINASAFRTGIYYRGIRGRRYLRRTVYVQRIKNDKLRIYKEYGFPIHRYRVYAYGRIVEHWKYLEKGVEFIFDENSKLLETRHFWPENRRERIEKFPRY